MRQTTDQKRCLHAHQQAASVDASDRAKYKTQARALPVMLLKNGIGQTLAFLRSGEANNPGMKLARAHLESWVASRLFENQTSDLLNRLMNADRSTWWRATHESVAYATWLKRWVDALMADVAEATE